MELWVVRPGCEAAIRHLVLGRRHVREATLAEMPSHTRALILAAVVKGLIGHEAPLALYDVWRNLTSQPLSGCLYMALGIQTELSVAWAEEIFAFGYAVRVVQEVSDGEGGKVPKDYACITHPCVTEVQMALAAYFGGMTLKVGGESFTFSPDAG